MKGVAEPRFFPLLRGQRLHRLQVEVVVQVEVVEVLAVYEQVEHVVALPAHLQSSLHPVQGGGLEELGGFERPEQISLLLWLWWSVLQSIQHKIFEQLLIADPDLDRLARRTVLSVPGLDQGDIQCSPGPA